MVDGQVTVLVNIQIDGTPEHLFATLVASVAQLMTFGILLRNGNGKKMCCYLGKCFRKF